MKYKAILKSIKSKCEICIYVACLTVIIRGYKKTFIKSKGQLQSVGDKLYHLYETNRFKLKVFNLINSNYQSVRFLTPTYTYSDYQGHNHILYCITALE